jgi:hypothetical protein
VKQADLFQQLEVMIERGDWTAHLLCELTRGSLFVDVQALNNREPYGGGQTLELNLIE